MNARPKMERPTDCPLCLDSIDLTVQPLKKCGHYMHLTCLSKHHKQECPICRRPQHDVIVTGKLDVPHYEPITQSSSDIVYTMSHPFLYLSENILDHPEEWELPKKQKYAAHDEEYLISLSDMELFQLYGKKVWEIILEEDSDYSYSSEDYPEEI